VSDSTSASAEPLPRHEARRRALTALYEADVRRRPLAGALDRVADDEHADPLDAFAESLVTGVAAHQAEIDAVITRFARGWSLERMPIVDRNVLRLGVYELLHVESTPPAVVIDEAVELAKELSTDDSPRYVNGVLSAIAGSEEAG
jgi:transcription antitermination protein NusB